MDKKLFVTRDEIYKKCPSIFWEVSFFTIIVAIALAALDALFPISYISFGFIFFPLLFSTYVTLFSIKFGGTVSVKSTLSISKSYFSRGNFGCFRLLKNVLIGFLTNVVFMLILSVALKPIFTYIYGSGFETELDELLNAANTDLEQLLNLLETNSAATLFYECTVSFSFSFGLVAFIYGVTHDSLNAYLCVNIPNATAMYCNTIFKKFLNRYGNSYRKDFFALNWPLFALLIFGIVGGYAFTILLDIDFSYGQVISTMFGLLCLVPFGPFYFAGMEALFAKYSETIKTVSADMTQSFLRSLRDNPNISPEDKEKIDELLSKEQNPPNDDDKKEE